MLTRSNRISVGKTGTEEPELATLRVAVKARERLGAGSLPRAPLGAPPSLSGCCGNSSESESGSKIEDIAIDLYGSKVNHADTTACSERVPANGSS